MGYSRTALVCGAGGFIGAPPRAHAEARGLLGARRRPEVPRVQRDRGRRLRRRRPARPGCRAARGRSTRFDEVYQLAADMGGAGYIFTGENDADIMHNSATINLNVLDACRTGATSSASSIRPRPACTRPTTRKTRTIRTAPRTAPIRPAPDSEYGWEKLFSERLYLAYARNHGMEVRIARYHNIFGPEGTWNGGKEKAPAAICRKVARADRTAARSRSGATASRPARSSTSTNASKAPCA